MLLIANEKKTLLFILKFYTEIVHINKMICFFLSHRKSNNAWWDLVRSISLYIVISCHSQWNDKFIGGRALSAQNDILAVMMRDGNAIFHCSYKLWDAIDSVHSALKAKHSTRRWLFSDYYILSADVNMDIPLLFAEEGANWRRSRQAYCLRFYTIKWRVWVGLVTLRIKWP